jgi:hypothetical protein
MVICAYSSVVRSWSALGGGRKSQEVSVISGKINTFGQLLLPGSVKL